MIDTIDIFYCFHNSYEFKTYKDSVDALSRERKQALHQGYTTAFSSLGILRIAFEIKKCRYCCRMSVQPAKMIHPDTHIRLAQENECLMFYRGMDKIITSINDQCGYNILPPILDWHVKRIDYAINIETPYVSEYIRLLQAGAIPKNFREIGQYESSLYLTSKSGNINFYDKRLQLRQKHGMSDEEIGKELQDPTKGILRLEFQCRNKYIQHLKKKYHLADTTLPYLWNANIAGNELYSRVYSIIWDRDFFSYDICLKKLEQRYKPRTLNHCWQIIRALRDGAYPSIQDLEDYLPPSNKKQFPQDLNKIRAVGVNPIPLEVTGNSTVTELANPCQLIRDALGITESRL